MSDDRGPLWHDDNGTAHFDVGAAAKQAEAELAEQQAWAREVAAQQRHMGRPRNAGLSPKEFNAAIQDLHRLGMSQGGQPGRPTPRAMVHPSALVPPGAGPDPSTLSGLGDIHSQITEPGARYYERWSQPRTIQKEVAVARAIPRCPLPPEMEKYRVLIEQCLGQTLIDSLEKWRKCGPWYVQPQTWLAPPITAINVDVFTKAAGVTLPGGVYPGIGDCISVLSIDVPDRWIFVLDRFGNELGDHLDYGNVRFSMQRNRTPIRAYGNFDNQLGRFVDPTKFGSAIILKTKDTFRLEAQSLVTESKLAFARIMGWAFAVRHTTGDGSHSEFCVQ